MTTAIWALIGVVVGSTITWLIAWFQIEHDTERRRVDRAIDTYRESIAAGTELIDVNINKRVTNEEERREWNRLRRSAYLAHWRTIGYLRLIGDIEVAQRTVAVHDYVRDHDESYLQSDAGWEDITRKAYEVIGLMETRIMSLEEELGFRGFLRRRGLQRLVTLWDILNRPIRLHT